MTTYRTNGGEQLDEICWRYYGFTAGAVEAVLEANQDLCLQPIELPEGVLIELPDISPKVSSSQPVNIWD